jgi:ComF family protein
MVSLPVTGFERHANNPVEKSFSGRLPFVSATAQYFYNKESLIQKLVHEVKYRGNRELGLQLGKLMGDQLKAGGRLFPEVLIPLPLFPARERKRGYNQAALLCEGISASIGVEVQSRVISRPAYTETQTKKGRIERWKNMEGKFILSDPGSIAGKHVLLVDDVITTGATLESCGTEILKAPGVQLSIAALCTASRFS